MPRLPQRNSNLFVDDEADASEFAFKEAIATISPYDGQNMAFLQYSKACKRACDIIPRRMERILTKMAIANFRGRAYFAVEDQYRRDLANIFTNRLTAGYVRMC